LAAENARRVAAQVRADRIDVYLTAALGAAMIAIVILAMALMA
jgi:hypothetical protein